MGEEHGSMCICVSLSLSLSLSECLTLGSLTPNLILKHQSGALDDEVLSALDFPSPTTRGGILAGVYDVNIDFMFNYNTPYV